MNNTRMENNRLILFMDIGGVKSISETNPSGNTSQPNI